MNIQLLNKRILLEQHKIVSKIITPDDVEYYQVYAIGDEVTKVKVGEKVLYENGRKFKVDNEEYILTDEDNIVLCQK